MGASGVVALGGAVYLASRKSVLGLGGAACLIGAVVFAGKLPELRKLVRPIYVQKGIVSDTKSVRVRFFL
jgi:hypothetical protein